MRLTHPSTFSLLTLGFALAIMVAVSPVASAAAGTLFVQDDQVLIGDDTPIPDAKFAVITDTGGVGGITAIHLQNNGSARIALINTNVVDGPSTNQQWTMTNGAGEFRIAAPGSGPEVTVDPSGNMNVRTSISVGGTALNVPDYVFDPDYELKPLSEVKAFIEQNRHLPDVPSAEEVAEKGLNMTNMQLVLLQKVEELTLYALEQQGRIQALETQLSELQATAE